MNAAFLGKHGEGFKLSVGTKRSYGTKNQQTLIKATHEMFRWNRLIRLIGINK